MYSQNLQGCIGETLFKYECLKRDIPLFEPVIDLYGVDFIAGKQRLAIQVKTCKKPFKETFYKICVRHGANSIAYIDQFDHVAVYLMQHQIWYIIPIDKLNKTTIRINPFSDKCKYYEFKEKFGVLEIHP